MNMVVIAFIVIIICSIYLYNDYRKNTGKAENSELNEGSWMSVLFAVLLGGGFALMLFFILQPMFSATDVQGFILVAVVILSSVICGCTAWIVKTLKGMDALGKEK